VLGCCDYLPSWLLSAINHTEFDAGTKEYLSERRSAAMGMFSLYKQALSTGNARADANSKEVRA
jgi:hypothetical protein